MICVSGGAVSEDGTPRDYVTPANASARWKHLRDSLFELGHSPPRGIDAAMHHLLTSSAQALDVFRASFWRIAEDRQSIRCEYQCTAAGLVEKPGTELTAVSAPRYFAALDASLTLAAEDALTDARTADLVSGYLQPEGIGALLDVAVRQSGQMIGVVCHEHTGGARAWASEERLFVTAIATMVGHQFEQQHLIELEAARQRALCVDELTGLANRNALLQTLTAVVGTTTGLPMALVVIDIDRFHRVNHAFGSEMGDRVLRAVADTLKALFAPESLARLAGDQFVVLLRADRIDEAIERIRDAIAGTSLIPERALGVSLSIGVVPSLAAYHGAEPVLRDAMIAVDVASRGRRGGVYRVDGNHHNAAEQRLRLEMRLRAALVANEFEFHLQPIMALHGARLVGAEALLRWRHPERGVLSPAEFLDVLEESARWRQLPEFSGFALHINLASVQLRSAQGVDHLLALFSAAGLAPSAVNIEITENTLLDQGSEIIAQLHHLARAGVPLSMDDFGTGFASISHLAELPLACMKIDRTFVARMGSEARATNLVRVLIDMAIELGLSVVAEGVESENELNLLRALGCSMAQGYLLGRPLPVSEFERHWIRGASVSS
ncbi:MAG: hypothetical protein CVV12_05155 [Gammaproteobacteria bacterium HGW-Gammaproteobacteria-2]|nr:MAG: hypothetical protein CVV12_05155 [Gammaproteobacteria bacterium HGW-Gammaproteobacteria-2]